MNIPEKKTDTQTTTTKRKQHQVQQNAPRSLQLEVTNADQKPKLFMPSNDFVSLLPSLKHSSNSNALPCIDISNISEQGYFVSVLI